MPGAGDYQVHVRACRNRINSDTFGYYADAYLTAGSFWRDDEFHDFHLSLSFNASDGYHEYHCDRTTQANAFFKSEDRYDITPCNGGITTSNPRVVAAWAYYDVKDDGEGTIESNKSTLPK
jgi:hypothetical protein